MTDPAPIGRMELLSTVVLALATVATAWAAYQSRQWTGEQAQGYSHATAARIQQNRASALANRNLQIDVATFIQWVDAHEQGDTKLAAFYSRRFRNQFRPAFAAWIATRPFVNAGAPPTPFSMPQYELKATARAARLEAQAASDSAQAQTANQTADDYMLAVVFSASALFFAGISLKLRSATVSTALVALASVVLLGTLIWLSTLPVR